MTILYIWSPSSISEIPQKVVKDRILMYYNFICNYLTQRDG